MERGQMPPKRRTGEKTDHSFVDKYLTGFRDDLSQETNAAAVDTAILVKHPVFSSVKFPISILIYSVKNKM